jgi:hypothetical protein
MVRVAELNGTLWKTPDPVEGGLDLKATTFVRAVQPLKALFPIEVIVLGIVTEVRPVQSRKAFSPIATTV